MTLERTRIHTQEVDKHDVYRVAAHAVAREARAAAHFEAPVGGRVLDPEPAVLVDRLLIAIGLVIQTLVATPAAIWKE